MLDFKDIQGNILRGYRSFPQARFLYFRISRAEVGKKFLNGLLRENLITAADWGPTRPRATTNLGLTMGGLRALQLPSEILGSFPHEYQQGMRLRSSDLGDVGDSAPENWDPPWHDGGVHLVLRVRTDDALKIETETESERLRDALQTQNIAVTAITVVDP